MSGLIGRWVDRAPRLYLRINLASRADPLWWIAAHDGLRYAMLVGAYRCHRPGEERYVIYALVVGPLMLRVGVAWPTAENGPAKSQA